MKACKRQFDQPPSEPLDDGVLRVLAVLVALMILTPFLMVALSLKAAL